MLRNTAPTLWRHFLKKRAVEFHAWEGTANILGLEVVRLVGKYDAHLLFIEQIKERIENLKGTEWAAKISPIWEVVQKEMHTFAALSYVEKTFYSKKIASKMNAMYETVVAAEWAIAHGGEFASLAEIFMDSEWESQQIGDEMKTVKYFK